MAANKFISLLSTSIPLKLDYNYVTDFADVSMYKKLRFSLESDSMLTLFFEWSMDGENTHIINTADAHANSWKTEALDVLMPYLRIRIDKQIPSSNNRLNLFTYPISINKATIPQDDEKSEKRKSHLPFFRLGGEKKEPQPQAQPRSLPQPQAESRISDFVPSGALLVGGKSNKVEFVPRGMSGEVLVMGEKGPIWLDISILKQ